MMGITIPHMIFGCFSCYSPYIYPPEPSHAASRRVIVMEYIDGIPILKMGDEMKKRGVNPDGKLAVAAKQ